MSNKASIAKKYIVCLPVKLESPLLIGSGENDWITDVKTVCNSKGEPYIPGTSVAGALRDSLKAQVEASIVESLFGSAKDAGQSLLNIADIKLMNTKLLNRDGVAIDPLTSVAIDGAKYDYMLVERGAQGLLLFELTIRRVGLRAVESYETALKSICQLFLNGLSVGAMSAKGLGKLVAQYAEYYKFDFVSEQSLRGYEAWKQYLAVYSRLAEKELENDRLKWLTELESCLGTPDFKITDKKPIINSEKLVLEAYFDIKSALLLKEDNISPEVEKLLLKESGSKSKTEGDNATNYTGYQMMSLDRYLIPGTSWKGVLRSKAYKLLRRIAGESADAEENCIHLLESLMGKSETLRSRLKVAETYIDKELLKLHKQARNRIDRLTGATQEGALFADVPAWKNTDERKIVKLQLEIEKCRSEEAGLVLLLLRELWLGMLPIGGGKGVGRGVLEGVEAKILFQDKCVQINDQDILSDKDCEYLNSFVTALKKELAVK